MKIKSSMTIALLALATIPAFALAGPTGPAKTAQSTGTRQNTNPYHDRTPVIHDRGTLAPR